jgi:hypothetical protein
MGSYRQKQGITGTSSRDEIETAKSADNVSKAAQSPGYVARVEHLTLMMYAGEPYSSTNTTQEMLCAAICVALMMVNRRYQRNIIRLDISAGKILIPMAVSSR